MAMYVCSAITYVHIIYVYAHAHLGCATCRSFHARKHMIQE